ncbi:MAG: hypothetical protein Q8R91_02695 [Candidatus Omnitrophota bacterium]|nr:hypothetical protein [Candidatus Omnitrophota bacterium]
MVREGMCRTGLRGQVEACLFKHGITQRILVPEGPIGRIVDGRWRWMRPHADREIGLLDDLCALLTPPTPDRKALNYIFGMHIQGQRHDHPEPCDRLADEIMAWATGQPRELRWCEHITWVDGRWRWMRPHADREMMYLDDHLTWDICPVAGCHAPRPAMPRTG